MIPFVDFTREYKAIKREINAAVLRVLARGPVTLGPEVENFEKNFARYCGVKHCVGVNSGTDALFLSLVVAGIGRGDEVIVPVNTALPTAMAVVMSGARPVFVDCDFSSLIDIGKIPASITKRTKAIIPVHLYGKACDMTRLRKMADDHRLVLIEDCAQAAGARWRGKKVGAWGDMACFSFYPTKNLGAYGDGGAVVTNNADYHKKLRAARFYGQANRVACTTFGINSRLDELQAVILDTKLKYVDSWNKKREELAGLYRRLIKNPVVSFPPAQKGHGHVYHLLVIRTKKRDALMKILAERGIKTMIHYPVLLHRQPFFKESKNRSFPNAHAVNGEILSLPMYPHLRQKEVEVIARVINQAVL